MTGPMIQAQWELSHTVFKTANMLFDLIKSAAQDNVQSQAVMALEGLGAGILVSPSRISDGYEALRQQHSRTFRLLDISVGLNGGGIARQMRKSTPLIAGFLFVTACKPCYTDAEIGTILFDMMAVNGLVNKIPISALQMGELVGAISSYCEKICPHEIYAGISELVSQNLPFPQHRGPPYCQLESSSIAGILSKVFDALRDEEISKVTLIGYQSGVWIVTVLLWLLPAEDIHVTVFGKTVGGSSKGKLSVVLDTKISPEWKIQEWRAEKDVVSVIKSSRPTSLEFSFRLMTLQPLKTTRIFLAHSWHLTKEELEVTALLAGSLITVAIEDGLIGSDHRKLAHWHNSVVALSDLCQPKFLATYSEMLADFGWHIDDSFRKLQADFVAHFRHWIEEGHDHQRYVTGRDSVHERLGMTEILAEAFSTATVKNIIGPCDYNNSHVPSVMQSSVRLAGEAVLGCLCLDPAKYCSLRSSEYQDIQTSSIMLYRLVFGGKVKDLRPFTIRGFRSEAMRANIPGATYVEKNQLAYSNNGYVIFSSVLKEPSSLPRDACALSILPGTIRWGVDQMQYQGIRESDPEMNLGGGFLQPISLFDRSGYLGFEAKSSSHGYQVETLISQSMRILWLNTYLSSDEPGSETVSVWWGEAIEALAVAKVVKGPSMTAVSERLLAQTWQEQGVFDRIAWLSAYSMDSDESMGLHVTLTAQDETLRFFAAGRYGTWRRIILRSGAPVIQCVQVALDLHKTEKHDFVAEDKKHVIDWIIIA